MSIQATIDEIAGPRGWNETRQSWLSRAARRAGVSYRSMRAAFYGEIADPEHKVIRRIRLAAKQEQQQIEEGTARDELAELRRRIAILESYILASEKDAASESLAASGNQIGPDVRSGG